MDKTTEVTTLNSCISWDMAVVGQFLVLKDDPPALYSVVWCSGAIGLLIVCMNFLVICSILRANNLRRNSVYIFVFSLAVADLLAAVVFVSTFLRFHLAKFEAAPTISLKNSSASELHELWKSNDKKLVQYLVKLTMVTTCFTASVGSLVLTAIDRFLAVVRPFDHHIIATRSRCVASILLMWAISIAISSLPVAGWRCDFECRGLPKSGCSQLFPGVSKNYLAFYVVVVVCLLLFVICMYIYIFTTVWKHYKKYCSAETKQRHRVTPVPCQTWPRASKPSGAVLLCQDGDEQRDSNRPSDGRNTTSRDSTMYELRIIEEKDGLDPIGKRGSKRYELCKDNFRFVLIVDEEEERQDASKMSERDRATSFRGYLFYNNNKVSRKDKQGANRIPYLSPSTARMRNHKRSDYKRNRNQMQIMQTLNLILGLLIFCWIPSVAFMIMDLTMDVSRGMKKAFAFAALLTLLNSAANPIIYAIRLQELRSIARRTLCRVKRQSNSHAQ